MAKMRTATLDEIVRLAGDFVTRKEGTWDHADWLGFLTTLQQKGIDLSEEMQAYVGQLLEAIKRFYQATASTQGVEKALATVVKDSVNFVRVHHAVWGHDEWEDFTRRVQENTLNLSEETTAYLGSILESMKAFYAIAPLPASMPKQHAAATTEKKKTKQAKQPASQPAAKEPEPRDDLTAIAGIGPVLQQKLNEQGIYNLAQIAALSDADIERLEENLVRFAGRIKREDWVGQAQRLSKEMR